MGPSKRLQELFEDDTGRLSMTRFLMFLSFFPAAYVVCVEPEGETLSWFLGAYAAAYSFGKFADKKQENQQPMVNVEGDVSVKSSAV